MQSKLFYDDEFEALSQMCTNSGKPIKAIAQFLWPDMKPDSAYSKLKSCLSSTGDERLKFGQVIALMVFTGQYDPLYFACDETMHGRAERKAPEDNIVKIAETIQNAIDVVANALPELERAQALMAQMRAVPRRVA